MNFAQGSDVDYTKSKIMKTYRSVKRRMQSRFTKNGVLQAKLFLVSSKKSDQDFIESYVETVRDEPTTYIVDEPQWNVKPPGTFSNKRFKVAVGDKKIHSKIVLEGDNLEDLEKQGYRIIDVPLELKKDFERDVDSSLMEFAGISSSIVTKFISYDSLKASYCNTENPFGTNIISIGTNDNLQIQDFFKPDMIPEIYRSKPLYIHIDGSLTGDRTGISGVWVIGLRETQEYTAEGDFTPVQELIYKHAFSIGIQCPAGAEISLEKNRKFIYYLKYSLGYNIKVVSLDGFQSADSKQQLLQAGFDANITSVDRTSDPYMYFKASINERRIAMINNIPELEEEIINLERNNMTGKIDHPNAGKEGSKDISDSICGALWNASKFEDISSLHVLEDFNTISETNALIVNTEENVMKNLTTSILSNETSEEPSLKDALKDAIQTLSKEQKENNLRLNRIKEARKNLSTEENARVRDEELESVIFNKDDNIIIW